MKNLWNKIKCGYTTFYRISIYCAIVIVVILLKFYMYDRYEQISGKFRFFFTSVEDGDDNSEVACQIPILDAFDKSILRFIYHPRSMVCKQFQENMTYIDMNGYLRINESAINNLIQHNITYTCHYRTFDRAPGVKDNNIKFNQEKLLTKPVKLDEDMVEVICRNNDSIEFYKNFHAHPAEKSDRLFAKHTDDQLNVMMFYIDSISYSVLQRNLPSTFNYTKNVMKINYFKAFNKIGDNSYPNLMAILTGKRVYDEQIGMMHEIVDRHRRFDHWPLIWKRYAAKGYATMFNEDVPEWGLFHYLSLGFAKKPVDYYYHTYWLALRNAYNKNFSKACFANQPHTQMFLDIAKRHLVSVNDSLQFMYNFYTELSHDYVNEVERFDDDLAAFWREMHEGGYLNKTIVVFGSDHGHRFSDVRGTLIGLLEERLPFYGLWFPSWFYDLYPNIKKNLKYNEHLLSSSFDVFETLKDIAEGNFDGVQRRPGSRGLSQLYPLPKKRTCRDAGIPDHYCTCTKETPIDMASNSALVQGIANYLIDSLNILLSENATNLCQTITLSKIQFILLIDFDEKVKQGAKSYDDAREVENKLSNNTLQKTQFPKLYRIAVDTEPFNAKFEATIRVTTEVKTNNKTITEMNMVGSVSRLNSYKGLSDCIDNAILRKYCSCKNVRISLTPTPLDRQ